MDCCCIGDILSPFRGGRMPPLRFWLIPTEYLDQLGIARRNMNFLAGAGGEDLRQANLPARDKWAHQSEVVPIFSLWDCFRIWAGIEHQIIQHDLDIFAARAALGR